MLSKRAAKALGKRLHDPRSVSRADDGLACAIVRYATLDDRCRRPKFDAYKALIVSKSVAR